MQKLPQRRFLNAMVTLPVEASQHDLTMAVRLSQSPTPTDITPQPRLVSNPILPRTQPGKCKALFATCLAQAATLIRRVLLPRPDWILYHQSLATVVTAVPAMAVNKMPTVSHRMSPIDLVLVQVLWASQGRLCFSSFLHAQLIHHSSMT
jgi:hypothetical protein